MTFANHPNITPIKMAINMGEPRTFTNQSTGREYIQHDRIYLIMDFAEFGSLQSFLEKNGDSMAPTDRIKLTKDCIYGKYSNPQYCDGLKLTFFF